jgi:hypothetical protein
MKEPEWEFVAYWVMDAAMVAATPVETVISD